MTVPLIQIALDYIELEPALAMAQLVADEVDVFEIGTPLCKAVGMLAVRIVRALFPDKIILADVKSPDVGGLEAKLAYDAGATWMTVMGSAAPATIRAALEEAKRQGKVAYVEMTGIRDILAAASEWKELGAEWLVYHREWDAGVAGRQWTPKDYEILKRLTDMGFKINVAGHINLQLLSFFKGLPLSVITIGREIREAADPTAAARQFREEIAKLWSASATLPKR
jgi:3-dehydro-L-gulonate-6-phosphate decarboxylase